MNETKTSLSDIAKILYLIAKRPNYRPDPVVPEKYLFDGGSVRLITGYSHFEFSDGTVAYSNTLPYLNLDITFPDGVQVTIHAGR